MAQRVNLAATGLPIRKKTFVAKEEAVAIGWVGQQAAAATWKAQGNASNIWAAASSASGAWIAQKEAKIGV